jgi:hypothetical protein
MLVVTAVVVFAPSDGSDLRAERINEFSALLERNEEVSYVKPVTTKPEGAKGLAVELVGVGIGIVGGLPGIVTLIQQWRERKRVSAVRLEIDGDVLELSGVSSSEQTLLIQSWLDRHDGTKP